MMGGDIKRLQSLRRKTDLKFSFQQLLVAYPKTQELFLHNAVRLCRAATKLDRTKLAKTTISDCLTSKVYLSTEGA